MASNVIPINEGIKDPIERLKKELEMDNIIIVGFNKDGTLGSFIESDISDIDLVYAIQCLKDRRRMIVDEVNNEEW